MHCPRPSMQCAQVMTKRIFCAVACITVASHAGVFRGARISSLPTPQEIRAPLKTPAWEASITGALQAKRGKRSICEKRESQDERRRKTKAPVAGPLFWLFHARLHLKWLLTDGGHVKRTNEKLKTRSINRQQHKLQEVKTTRTWITFNNVRLTTAAKTRFSQSKFSSCSNTATRKKSGKTCCSYYSRLPVTRTLANSDQNRFPLDFRHTFTVILPSITRILDNSNSRKLEPIFVSPQVICYIILPSITRTVFWALKKSGEKPSSSVWTNEFWISY